MKEYIVEVDLEYRNTESDWMRLEIKAENKLAVLKKIKATLKTGEINGDDSHLQFDRTQVLSTKIHITEIEPPKPKKESWIHRLVMWV